MDNSFSGKGKAWEWRHSIWILWTLPFPGFTSFISFLYIGKIIVCSLSALNFLYYRLKYKNTDLKRWRL